MISWRCLLFLLLPLFFILKSEASDQLTFRYHECNQMIGNFTDGSDYQINRDTVLEQIYSDKEIDYGFYNFSYGEEPDKVNAIGFCRGDINSEDCRGCLKASATLLIERCGIQKEAIGYFDLCSLRYSNDSIFGVMETKTSNYFNIEVNTMANDAFNQTRDDLLDELKSAAADGDSRKKFAEKSAKVIDESSSTDANDTIYGLVQCTPDLSKQECSECLDLAFGQISRWCTKGCLYLGPSCSVRYDNSSFYKTMVDNTEPPTAAPQPSQALPPSLSPKTTSANSTNTTSTSKGTFPF